MFHTKILPALLDPSFWPSAGAIVVGAWALEGVPRYVTITFGIIGMLLKGGPQPPAVA